VIDLTSVDFPAQRANRYDEVNVGVRKNQPTTSWITSQPCTQHKVFSRRSMLPTGNLATLALVRADTCMATRNLMPERHSPLQAHNPLLISAWTND